MRILFILIVFLTADCFAQSQQYIQVHFLYGSKPKKEYRKTEPKWFGGMLGGHVGVETDSNQVVNFIPKGKSHFFANKKDKHSAYTIHSRESFWEIMDNNGNVKKLTVVIPVSDNQKAKLDSVHKTYLAKSPYDYALFGIRCGAATYDVLAQAGILKPFSRNATVMKIFYPKKVRKKLIRLATKHQWQMIRVEGSTKRKWEKD
jgi:hypothetical protein